MKIFLSYASEAKNKAEPIAFSLRARGHKVFLDKDDLPPGESYDEQIGEAIAQSDLFIFLITPESVTKGRFTQTELAWARKKWPTADRHVLPVMAEDCDLAQVPSYLKSVTILEPHGNLAAEVAAAVQDLGRGLPVASIVPLMATLGLVSGLASGLLPNVLPDQIWGSVITPPSFILNVGKLAPLHAPLIFAAALTAGLMRAEKIMPKSMLVLLVATIVGWLLAVNATLNLVAFFDPKSMEKLGSVDESVRSQVASLYNVVGTFIWLAASAAGGFIGACITLIGARSWVPRLNSTATVMLVAAVGAITGMLAKPTMNAEMPYLLFAIWQSAVAAAIGYGLSKPLR